MYTLNESVAKFSHKFVISPNYHKIKKKHIFDEWMLVFIRFETTKMETSDYTPWVAKQETASLVSPLRKLTKKELGWLAGSERILVHYSSLRSSLNEQKVWETTMHMAMVAGMLLGKGVNYMSILVPRHKKNLVDKFGQELPGTAGSYMWTAGGEPSRFNRKDMMRLENGFNTLETIYAKQIPLLHGPIFRWGFEKFREHLFFARKAFAYAMKKSCRLHRCKEKVVDDMILREMCRQTFGACTTYRAFYRTVHLKWEEESKKRKRNGVEEDKEERRQVSRQRMRFAFGDGPIPVTGIEVEGDHVKPSLVVTETKHEKDAFSKLNQWSQEEREDPGQSTSKRVSEEMGDNNERETTQRTDSSVDNLETCLAKAGWRIFCEKGGDPPQIMCVEKGKVGSPQDNNKDWRKAFENNQSSLEKIVIFPVSSSGVWGFWDSHKAYHFEGEGQRRHRFLVNTNGVHSYDRFVSAEENDDPPQWELVEGNVYVYKSDDDIIREYCKLHGIHCTELFGKENDLSSDFVRVCHGSSAEYKETFASLCFDLPAVVEALLRLREKGDANTGERGPIQRDYGYAHKKYDHSMPIGASGITTNAPEMCKRETDEDRIILEQMGDLADRVTSLMDKYWTRQGEYNYDDEERTNLFGKRFGKKMNSRKSRFEALTVGLTKVGKRNKDGKMIFNKENTLSRHRDGPNDGSRRYSLSMIKWWLVEDGDGNLWRLAVVFYSRKSIRDTLARERDVYKPIFERLDGWKEQMIGWDYLTVNGNDFGDSDIGKVVFSDKHELVGWKLRPNENPMAYWSLVISSISDLIDDYNLSRRKVVELVYLAMKTQSSATFAYVLGRWRKHNKSTCLKNKEGTADFDFPNFIWKYNQECIAIGLESGLNSGKGHTRYVVSETSFIGAELEDDPFVQKTVTFLLDEAIPLANGDILNANGEKASHHEVITFLEKDKDLPYIKKVRALCFYTLCVHLGLLTSTHAKKESMHATASNNSGFYKYMKRRDSILGRSVTTDTNLINSMMRRYSQKHDDMPLFVVENLFCKMGRATYVRQGRVCQILLPEEKSLDNHGDGLDLEREHFRDGTYPTESTVDTLLKNHGDIMIPGQWIYNRRCVVDHSGSASVLLERRRLNASVWEIHYPPKLH